MSVSAKEGPAFDVGELEKRIRRRLGTRIREFKVIVQDDGLVLRGEAASFYTKQLVQQAAMELVPTWCRTTSRSTADDHDVGWSLSGVNSFRHPFC